MHSHRWHRCGSAPASGKLGRSHVFNTKFSQHLLVRDEGRTNVIGRDKTKPTLYSHTP
jgi:hypothetical protein